MSLRQRPHIATVVGIVSDHKGSQQREALVTADEWAVIKSQRNREVATGNFEADLPDDNTE